MLRIVRPSVANEGGAQVASIGFVFLYKSAKRKKMLDYSWTTVFRGGDIGFCWPGIQFWKPGGHERKHQVHTWRNTPPHEMLHVPADKKSKREQTPPTTGLI